MRDLMSKEGITFLILGIFCGSLYYNFYLAPRDEALKSIMSCMKDLHSKTEYDRCADQFMKSK